MRPAKGAWGPWATVGWTAILGVAFTGAQIVVVILYVLAGGVASAGEFAAAFDAAAASGSVLGLASLASALVVAGLVVLFITIRKGPTVRDYLGLHWPSPKACVGWTVAVVVVIAAGDSLSKALGRPLVPDDMVQIYKGAGSLPVLWLGVVIGAPVGEELIFRGFLFRGLQQSRIGGIGAVIVTSIVFAAIHTQYDAYFMTLVLATALLLGVARLKTGSLSLCVLMHAVQNLVASVEVAIFY